METRNASIGLFVIAGLVLFGLGMFLIGDRHEVFARHREYYAEFLNLAGLTKGAKVRVAGMDAGEVLAIGVPDSPSSRFRIKFRIDNKLSGLVRVDSVAVIGTEGVVGDTFLSIRPGTAHAAEAAALSTIPGKEPTEISDLLTQGQSLLADADNMLRASGASLTPHWMASRLRFRMPTMLWLDSSRAAGQRECCFPTTRWQARFAMT
jgi:phospholipid/cholesterol/gamma-HCH transport system substrate-binding protein